MRIRFDPQQDHQLAAIHAVADLFVGQPPAFGTHDHVMGEQPGLIFAEVGFANRLLIDEATLLANVQAVQERHKLPASPSLARPVLVDGTPNAPSFSIEMETGTGKTYCYLRSIFELHRRYGWSKYVIVAPSVPIREGVLAAARQMAEHFREEYGEVPMEVWDYRSDQASRLRQFATSNQIQVLVVTVQAFDADDRVMNNPHDRLSGRNPIEYISGVQPIVILDEPQNLDSELRRAAIHRLDPLFTLRWSATHRTPFNLLYRLGPVQAYDSRLVKAIEVLSVMEDGHLDRPWLRLSGFSTGRGRPKAIIDCLKVNAAGRPVEATVTIGDGDDLATKARNPGYAGYLVDLVDAGLQQVTFANGVILAAGERHGGDRAMIQRAQIRETIRRHLDKERFIARLPADARMKVLSLFFIDRVANYVGDEAPLRKMFVEEYRALLGTYPELGLPTDPAAVHSGYFSQRAGEIRDSSETRNTQADDEAYEKIMRDKERLLDLSEPLRFIFSHSALSEGWDNPNVFQICVLREQTAETRRRQMVGRGLRLPVRADGLRCRDERLNLLTVIANESFAQFARHLQTEIEQETGESFAGRIGDARQRVPVNLNRARLLDPDFRALWELIKLRTRYAVDFDSEGLISQAVDEIRSLPVPAAPCLTILAHRLGFTSRDDGQAEGVVGVQTASPRDIGIPLEGRVPDLIAPIQRALESDHVALTRTTIARILVESGRLDHARINPLLWLEGVIGAIRRALRQRMVAGVRYERLTGEEWDVRQFEDPGWQAYLDRTIAIDHGLYDRIEVDSEVERRFAAALDRLGDVKLFLKLPSWFKVPTPLGSYNPDWAIVRERDGEPPRLFLVRETKGVAAFDDLDQAERQKITCGERHFELIQRVTEGAISYRWCDDTTHL